MNKIISTFLNLLKYLIALMLLFSISFLSDIFTLD